jgi:poly(3-hydroxybutyrate) depolymerase
MHLTPYDIGLTPFYALQSDPRLSYCLYVPRGYDPAGVTRYKLVVVVHGTDRSAGFYRHQFAQFAEDNEAIILAPLFPCNLAFTGDYENYKILLAGGIRFDLALLSMVEEVAGRYRVEADRFCLHGFSGGGHFAHRFLYVHAGRLRAVSIGAPGVVTLADPAQPFPLGLAGMAEFLGTPLQTDLMKQVSIQCIVGAKDTDTHEIHVGKNEVFWNPGINSTGKTRIERLKTLCRSLQSAGCAVSFEIVPGAGHSERQLFPAVQHFLKRHM